MTVFQATVQGKYPEVPCAEVEVSEVEAPENPLPVLLSLPAAQVLDGALEGEEADVAHPMTADEAEALGWQLIRAAQAARGENTEARANA